MSRQNGFTLIELMIVVVIIGILAAVALPNFIAMQDRAREASTKANMHVLELAAEDFATWNDGQYPETAEAAMQDGKPLVNPFGGDVAMENAAAPSPVPGIVAYGYGSSSVIGGPGPGSLIGVRPPTNGFSVRGFGKSAPLSLVLVNGGGQ